jgi:hypothetical protein
VEGVEGITERNKKSRLNKEGELNLKANLKFNVTGPMLDGYRFEGDALVDELLFTWLAEDKGTFYGLMKGDGEQLLEAIRTRKPVLAEQYNVFSHCSATERQEAQGIYQQFQPEVMLLLGCYSLPYCYAAAIGSQVLWQTGRLHEGALVRLQQTARFVWDVGQGTMGEVAIACLKVRLIHGLVRFHLMHSGWDAAKLGVPANQEDMAGTNLAFGFLVLRGLRKLHAGLLPSRGQAYLRYWNGIGAWLGIVPALLPPTLPDALALEQLIAGRHHKESMEGKGLTQSLLASIEEGPAPAAVKKQMPAMMRFMLGEEIADMIAVPHGEAEGLPAMARLNQLRALTGIQFNWGLGTTMAREMRRHQVSFRD